MTKAYKYDLETMETIFQEIAIELQDNQNAESAFVGERNSDETFWHYFKRALDDVKGEINILQFASYKMVLLCATILIEWLIWIRQNHPPE
jgi:hypothetical protein